MLGMTPLAWSPLGGGRLADPGDAREVAVVAALDRIAADHGVSRSVAAYSWLMAHPAGIIPIIGSQNPARIAEGMRAATIQWTREDWYAVFCRRERREAAMTTPIQQCEIAWFSALCDDDYEFLGRSRSRAQVELGALPQHRDARRGGRLRQYPAALGL